MIVRTEKELEVIMGSSIINLYYTPISTLNKRMKKMMLKKALPVKIMLISKHINTIAQRNKEKS